MTYALGLAQISFLEKKGYLPYRPKKSIRWPQLHAAVKQGKFSFIDYAFAEAVLRNYPVADEKAAAFLCRLSLASREGHVCLQVDKEEGLALLPEGVISDALDDAIPLTPLCRYKDFVYLQKNWVHESLILKNFKRLLNANPEIALDIEIAKAKALHLMEEKVLTAEQAQAVIQAIENSLTIICGGPGCGKTYTAAQFLKLFLETLSSEQQSACEIAVAAPTGKAASNLYKGLFVALKSFSLPMIQPRTLHSLLGIKKKSSPNFLTADLILVDEASMIDAKLMALLISSVKPGARLILLGDKHQLPAVEAGSLFADMNAALLSSTDLMKHRVEFTTCLRAELKNIVTLADKINSGDDGEVIKMLEAGDVEGVSRVLLKNSDSRKIRHALLEYAVPMFPCPSFDKSKLHQILNNYNRFRILTPLRKGFLGTEELNRLFFTEISKTVTQSDFIVSPIVISSNDYKLNLFNGEGGLLIQRNRSQPFQIQEGDYALFPDSGNFRKVPAVLLPKFEYAYCLSVHKSQGSEFEQALLLLPEGSESFGREMLYTAVTRAKRKIEIWGSNEVITQALQKTTHRSSGFLHRFLKQL